MAPQRRKSPVPARPLQDAPAVRRAVAGLIRALGLDPATEPELAQTPGRVADLYAEIFAGLEPGAEPSPVTFPAARPARGRARDLVIVRDLPYYSLCVHHFVPFFGHAHVAYLPGRRLIGLSGIARVLEFYARRPQLQERLTAQVADHLVRLLAAARRGRGDRGPAPVHGDARRAQERRLRDPRPARGAGEAGVGGPGPRRTGPAAASAAAGPAGERRGEPEGRDEP